jgi:hypothetical protein
MESKEAVRERVRRFRMQKRGAVSPSTEPKEITVATPDVINPVILRMFRDVDVRLSVLEARDAVEPVVREVLGGSRGRVDVVGKQVQKTKDSPADLFKRVVAEKAARVMGVEE